MNTAESTDKDHARDLLPAAEAAGAARLSAERLALAGLARAEQPGETRTAFGNRFLTALLRALSAWPV